MRRSTGSKPKQAPTPEPGLVARDAGKLFRRGGDLGLVRGDSDVASAVEPDSPGPCLMEPLLNVRDVMALLQVSRATVYSWVNQQKVPHLRINGVLRFSSYRLNAWLLERERGPRPEIAKTGSGCCLAVRRRATTESQADASWEEGAQPKRLIDLEAVRS